MQVPRITKITLNMGVGEAKTDAKVLDAAMDELTHHRRPARAAAPRPQVGRRSSRSARACRSARASRCAATGCGSSSTGSSRSRCRASATSAGCNPNSFDGRGNYSLGLREQIIFPEIDYDEIKEIRGLDVAITTTAETDEQAEALLRGLGMPLATEERRD